MEIKKVLIRKDGVKMIIVPKHSDIKSGDYVTIKKTEVKNDRSERED
jgi:hypothetical protein